MTINSAPEALERITSHPEVCHGQPVVKGTRIMVWLVLEFLANGDSVDDLLAAYPTLSREDVQACLAYAAKSAQVRIVPMEATGDAFQAR